MRVLLFILALLAARAAFFCERQNKSERRSLANHKPFTIIIITPLSL